MGKYFVFAAVLCSTWGLQAQKQVRVLFIGNSFTYTNNLPQTIANLAAAEGDTLLFASSTPGGYTLEMHCSYGPTLSAIAAGGWDYVILQEQSELPAFPPMQVDTQVYPYAMRLDSLIHVADSCTETVFFLTWGHQNGDPLNCAYYPQICTYTGMQDRLSQSYLQMGRLDSATVAPVGEAWRSIMAQPHGFNLYVSDSTHPSIFGTYLAASVFYEVLFQKTVLADSFVTAGIADSNAFQLRQAAHRTVNDSLIVWFGSGHIPLALFTDSIAGMQVYFKSASINGSEFSWDFGDGHMAGGSAAIHTYDSAGTYTVKLTLTENCKISTFTDTVKLSKSDEIAALDDKRISLIPNPAKTFLTIETNGVLVQRLCIKEASGREILQQNSRLTNSFRINVSGLSPGIYFMELFSDGQILHKEFIIE